MTRHSTTIDPKIDRLQRALQLSTADAHWLASVADEVDAAPGTNVGHSRFAHVVIGADGDTFVVEAGAPPVCLVNHATVLVMPRRAADELAARASRATSTVPPPRVARLAV
jgi:Xaa-Pro aminopeptidase